MDFNAVPRHHWQQMDFNAVPRHHWQQMDFAMSSDVFLSATGRAREQEGQRQEMAKVLWATFWLAKSGGCSTRGGGFETLDLLFKMFTLWPESRIGSML
jgi:hypothetical protein